MVRLLPFIAVFALAASRQGGLELGARFQDRAPVFAEGEAAPLLVRWRNLGAPGSPPLRINRRGLPRHEIFFDVSDAAGRRIRMGDLPSRPLAPADFQTLAPGEAVEYRYDLPGLLARPLESGSYRVRVRYRNADARGDPPAWTGELETASLRFRVRRGRGYFLTIPSSSTSNTRAAPPGMRGGAPWSP